MAEKDQSSSLPTNSTVVCTCSPYPSLVDTGGNDYYAITAECLALSQLSIFCFLFYFPLSFLSSNRLLLRQL